MDTHDTPQPVNRKPRLQTDFPDPLAEPRRRPASETAQVARTVHLGDQALLTAVNRHGANLTHLLAVLTGWMAFVGVIGFLMFAVLMAEVVTDAMSEINAEPDWDERKFLIAGYLITAALVVLVPIGVAFAARKAGFKMFKITS